MPHIFQLLFTKQSTRTYNPLGPARPWHYSLQSYTTLGVLIAFSMLLKLIFYHITYMATISVEMHVDVFVIPKQ